MPTREQLIIWLGENREENLHRLKREGDAYFEGFKVRTEEKITDEYNGDGGLIFSLTEKIGKKETEYWRIPGYYSSDSGLCLQIFEIFQVVPKPIQKIEWTPV